MDVRRIENVFICLLLQQHPPNLQHLSNGFQFYFKQTQIKANKSIYLMVGQSAL